MNFFVSIIFFVNSQHGKLPQSHDRFFKHLLSDLKRAREYLQAYLPEELLAELDLDTLKLENGSFIDDALKESFSDLVFSVSTRKVTFTRLYSFISLVKSRPGRNG